MCEMLSSINRAMAIVRRSISAEGFLQCDKPVFFWVECQGNEGLESTRFVLQRTEPNQVVDAMIRRLDVSVKHRTVRANA